MKTVACCSSHTPAKFIPAPGFTSQPATSAWLLWQRLTAAHRYSRCCGTTSTLRENAESAPLRASAEDRARVLMPCVETCSRKTRRVFIVRQLWQRYAIARPRYYLQKKWRLRNPSIRKGAGSRRLPCSLRMNRLLELVSIE